MNPLTKEQIITNFMLYYDDGSALSDQEMSDLFDKVYSEILTAKPYEISKKQFSGTQSVSSPNVTLPTRFAYLVQNANQTNDWTEASGPVVFVGASYKPYKVVSWSDRRQYRDQDGYCYIDIGANALVFTKQPVSADSVEFDYIEFPAPLSLSEYPIFPADYHPAIYHGMQIDQNIIEMSDKAKSYAAENSARYASFIRGLDYWNSKLIQFN